MGDDWLRNTGKVTLQSKKEYEPINSAIDVGSSWKKNSSHRGRF